MSQEVNTELRRRIMDEMTVDYSNLLEKNFELAKDFIRLTRDGRVDVRVKDKLAGKEQILLYLIGKLYAREAGFVDDIDVGNKELMEEVGIPEGSLLPWLKDLRDSNKIKQVRKGRYTYHSISLNYVERTLKGVLKKVSGGA